MATTLMGLGLATALTGLALIVTGKLKLARLVQSRGWKGCLVELAAVASRSLYFRSSRVFSLCTCDIAGYERRPLPRYLPVPVIGGYLAFIGLYTGEAGLSLMTGLSIDGPAAWPLQLQACHTMCCDALSSHASQMPASAAATAAAPVQP